MKTIELKNGKLKTGEEKSFEDLIQVALDNVNPQTGLTFKDFKERDRIEKVLGKAAIIEGEGLNKFVSFEDNDLEILKRLVNDVKWSIRDPFIFEFIDYIDKL